MKCATLIHDGDILKKSPITTFEGDYKLTSFIWAPPLLSKIALMAFPVKASFFHMGLTAFKWLARLRTSAWNSWDIFG